MIRPAEIQQIARRQGVRDTQIEKDYIISWILTGIPEFEEKTKFKNLNPDNLEKRLEQLLPVFKTRWVGSMSEQINELPPFEQVSRELGRHFRKLF